MRRLIRTIALAALPALTHLLAQSQAPGSGPEQPAIRVTSRAVLVDVVVTGHKGEPVTALKRDDFAVTEQGVQQTISFFEEHKAGPHAAPAQMPQLPPDVFSNFSPDPLPPAVNVLLLDSLNTGTDNQSFVHSQAMKFPKSAKPGSPMAIFTMGQQLHLSRDSRAIRRF